MILDYPEFGQCTTISKSISFFGPKIWNILPDETKQ